MQFPNRIIPWLSSYFDSFSSSGCCYREPCHVRTYVRARLGPLPLYLKISVTLTNQSHFLRKFDSFSVMFNIFYYLKTTQQIVGTLKTDLWRRGAYHVLSEWDSFTKGVVLAYILRCVKTRRALLQGLIFPTKMYNLKVLWHLKLLTVEISIYMERHMPSSELLKTDDDTLEWEE